MSKTILITGGTGLVGQRLTELLIAKGYQVQYLSRNPDKVSGIKSFHWDVKNQEMDKDALKDADVIVHLAGAGVADKKWSKERKKEILDSRTKSSELIAKTLSENTHKVKTVVSASAIGYYGWDTGGVVKKEESRFGDDFLATVTKAWEAEVDKIESSDIRVVKLRIGVVLSEKGGALKEISKPVKMGAGAALGSGDQFMSWIHIDDLCEMFIHAIENENLKGAFNAVAPNPVTNKELTKLTAKALKKPFFLPNVPGFVLKLTLGEMASIVLGGSKISSEKIESAGFNFKFEKADAALADLLG